MRLEKALDKLSTGLFWLAALAMTAMMVQVVADILGKYFFNQPIPGTLEIVSAYYMVAIIFLPLGLVQKDRDHVVVDLFTQRLPGRARDVLEGVVCAFTSLYMAILFWTTTESAVNATLVDETLSAIHYEISVWPGRWFIPIGSGAMTAYLILQGIRSGAGALRRTGG